MPKTDSLSLQMEQTSATSHPVAYSYVRFSSAKQQLGDSLRRQVQACENYCIKNHITLHPVSYRDLGVSAFKNKNIERGALAAFISAVKSGKIAKGSYLIIEQFDRMSRADASTALQLLLDLVKSGIKVVTLDDEKVWDSETINDTVNLMLAIMYMSRANNESQSKADRLTAIWGEKKKRAADGSAKRIVTSECPRWLKPNSDKTGFIVIEDRVQSIKKVFEMRINGFGISSIVRRANDGSWPCPGKPPVRKAGETLEDFEIRRHQCNTWHTSNVGRLLKNRALLGEYQPHINDPEDENKRIPSGDVIRGYYPSVLTEEVFLRAQAKAERTGRFPGRRDASLKNWLQGMLRCTCGHSFVRKNKDSKAQPGYSLYYCTARTRGITNCPSANAQELESAVISIVSGVAPQFFDWTGRTDDLKAKADLLEIKVSAAKHTRDRFVDAIQTSTVPVGILVQRLREAEAELIAADAALRAMRAEIADLSGDYDTVFESIVKAIRDVNSLDGRARLREDLSRVVEKVVVYQQDGYVRAFLRAIDVPIVHPLRVDAKIPYLCNGPQDSPGSSIPRTAIDPDYDRVTGHMVQMEM